MNRNAEDFIKLFNKEQTITSPEAFVQQPSQPLISQISDIPNPNTLQVIESTPKDLIQSDTAMPNDQNRFGFSATAQLAPNTTDIYSKSKLGVDIAIPSNVAEANLPELKTDIKIKDSIPAKQDYSILNPVGQKEDTTEASSLTDASLLSTESSETSVISESSKKEKSESKTTKSPSLSKEKSKSKTKNLD